MRFSEVQPELSTLLSAAATLAGITIITWAGTNAQKNEIEKQLREKGIVIVVDLPMKGEAVSQNSTKATQDAVIAVDALVNTERSDAENNEEAIEVHPDVLLERIVAAAINPSTRPTNEHDRFQYSGFEPYPDAGLLGRTIFFTKRCVL